MPPEPTGRDLFIVDNSVSGWTGLRYLEEWSTIAKSFDIATGYFEIGSLLALDGKWQGLEKIRILMGSDTTHRTRRALLDAVRGYLVQRKLDLFAGLVRNIEGYQRDFLKDQFLASLEGRSWVERDDAMRAFARWMGFRRKGPVIEDTTRSLINGLQRDGRPESDGSSRVRRIG